MVVYILGNSIAKRQVYSQTNSDTVYVDNEEVLSANKTDDGWWFAIGKNPFADMTVESYVAYERAFIEKDGMSRKHIKSLLKTAKFKRNSAIKMGRLNAFDLRKVQIASKIKPDTKRLIVNFDGTVFNRKNQKALTSFIRDLKGFSLYVCVSDTRFVKQPCAVSYVEDDGEKHYVPLYYTSKKKRVKQLLKPIKTAVEENGVLKVKKAVKCSNFTK